MRREIRSWSRSSGEAAASWTAAAAAVRFGRTNAGTHTDQSHHDQPVSAIADRLSSFRDGATMLLENTDVVVGDIYILDTGDKVVADGIVFDSQGLVIDEASLTGESDPIKKVPEDDCWVRSGTQVCV